MIQASICTIGDEILIGQVVDTNSSHLAVALEEAGIRVTRMLSIGDDREESLNNLRNELTLNDIVITTGGLGPTKDDITKDVLAELSGSFEYVENEEQLAIIEEILPQGNGAGHGVPLSGGFLQRHAVRPSRRSVRGSGRHSIRHGGHSHTLSPE